MKLDDSNKRYSAIIAGILIISVASIFVANLMGLRGYSIRSSSNLQLESAGIPFCDENSKSGVIEGDSHNRTNDVHIAQWCEVDCIDTEPGKIEVHEVYYDNVPLPLCVTAETVDDWYVIVNVTGGYEFTDGSIEFYQGKTGAKELVWNDCIQGMYLGYDLDSMDVTDQYKPPDCTEECCCCWKMIKIYVNPSCNNWACLDSNQMPEICGDCWFEVPPVDLDKEVMIKIKTEWEGCPSPDQQFEIIYAHKNCVHGIPNSRI
jgi:hypothetical protein